MTERRRGLRLHRIGSLVCWFFAVLGILVFLLWLSAGIPREAIRDNILSSAQYLEEQEDEFYRLLPEWEQTKVDNYADAILWNLMYSVEGRTPGERFKSLILSAFYSDAGNAEYPMLRLLIERIEEDRMADTIYDRYWHGMMLVLRPLFVWLDIRQLRLLALILLLSGMAWLSIGLWKKGLKGMAASLWPAGVLVCFPMAAGCAEYMSTWFIMLAVSLLCLSGCRRERFYGFMVLAGVCCGFFDFLTTETLTFVLPAAVWLGVRERRNQLQGFAKELGTLLKAGLAWLLAYFGTMGSKWLLASLLSGQNRAQSALTMLLYRQGGETGAAYTGGMPQPIAAVAVNLKLLLGIPAQASLEGVLTGAVFLTGAVSCFVYLYRKKKEGCLLAALWYLLALIPLFRFLVLHTHSIQHSFFTYRALFGTLVCVLAATGEIVEWRKARGKTGKPGI